MEPAAELTMRPVQASDLDPVADLQAAAIMALGTPVYGRTRCAAWARLGREFRHQLLGDGGFWVAAEGHRIIGVGGWSPDGTEADLAWIRYLFVDPRAVRRGIGRRLVDTAEGAARAAGRPRLHVWSSLNAADFYQALGYRRRRLVRWPIQRGLELDHLLMTKRLQLTRDAVSIAS